VTVMSRLAGRLGRLPPRTVQRVVVERDLRVPVAPDVELLADHYRPIGGERLPTLLVRSPYGRRGVWGLVYGQLFAERGFQVLVQSTRGAYGSGGSLEEPMIHEIADGRATVAWLREQPWFSGQLVTLGSSYLAFTGWAVAADPPPELKAVVSFVGPEEWRDVAYPGGAFALDTAMSWAAGVVKANEPANVLLSLLTLVRPGGRRKLQPVFTGLPLSVSYQQALGRPVKFFQEWLDHPPADPYWDDYDASKALQALSSSTPVLLVGGWHDLFIAQTINQFLTLRDRGVPVDLTVGPWTHRGLAGDWARLIKDTLPWLRSQLASPDAPGKSSARVYVTGAEEWRQMRAWPPADVVPVRWYLQPGGGLAATSTASGPPDTYRYDPADPTPAVGGATLAPDAGARDNRALERRADVLTYTSEALDTDRELAGTGTAELLVSSSCHETDFFVRLCDVHPSGLSINVCDGIRRVELPTAGGLVRMAVEMSPAAHRFRRGHRLRVQVSSGAHPRFARGLGTEAPLATASAMVPASQQLHHAQSTASALVLPMSP